MEASSYMVSYAHPHPPGEQWICTTPGIQKSATVVSHHVSYTYNWGNTKYLFMEAYSYMVSYAHPHPPGEQWICTTPGIQKSSTVVSHHVSYTYNWGNTKYL